MRHRFELVTARIAACCLAGSLLVPAGGCGSDDRPPPCKTGTNCGLGGHTSTSGTGGEGAGGGGASSMMNWVSVYGDTAAQTARSVATDSQGNVYFAGYYSGMMAIGGEQFPDNTAHDIYLIKLDPAGEAQWIHPFGQNGPLPGAQDEIRVAVDPSDNVVVTSAIIGDTTIGLDTPAVYPQNGNEESLFVAKLDGDGGFVWAAAIASGGAGVTARGVDCDGAGNVFVVGDVEGNDISFQGPTIDLGEGGVFVAKLAHDTGAVSWTRGYPHSSVSVAGRDIAIDSAGDAIIIGDFQHTLTLQNGELVSTASGPNPTDVFLIKLAAQDGSELWVEKYGGTTGQQLGHAVAVDGDDNIYVAAAFLAQIDFGLGPHEADGVAYDPVIAKLGPNANCLWSVAFASLEAQQAWAMDVAENGDVAITGVFQAEMNITVPSLVTKGNDDAFVAQLDSEGLVDWARSVGGPGNQHGLGVSIDGNGNVVFVGFTDGDIELAGDQLVHGGGGDILIGSIDGTAEQ